MGYQTTDGLMNHLRDNGIEINSSIQKRQLINTGYYHGYKGYRFFNKSTTRLPFSSYSEVFATIQYDSDLKSLLYAKVMYIETAIKNIALQSILENADSESIQDMFDKVVCGYQNSPPQFNKNQKEKAQQNKLNLQNSIQSSLAKAYRNKNPKITHFYNNIGHSDVPIWALFEIMTMGDLGHLLSCLTYPVRDDITHRIGINTSCDTNRALIYKYIYAIKDLRNAIAHNAVVFDTRFSDYDPSKEMTKTLMMEIGLPYVNFKTIGDYIILISYYLKLLEVSKVEIESFVNQFENITDKYIHSVNPNVSKIVIHPDLNSRMNILKKYI